jgi:hypothetical protein
MEIIEGKPERIKVGKRRDGCNGPVYHFQGLVKNLQSLSIIKEPVSMERTSPKKPSVHVLK